MGERNLHPVLWKGMVLADNFYPDPGTRPMGDIDFAIAPEEMNEATEVFQSLGFDSQDQAAIFISDCLSTVKMADRIYLLEKGIIVALGHP
jgi:ABC-type glutathione transport system ATPase component